MLKVRFELPVSCESPSPSVKRSSPTTDRYAIAPVGRVTWFVLWWKEGREGRVIEDIQLVVRIGPGGREGAGWLGRSEAARLDEWKGN